MQSALAARAGVFSALLAERGVGAPEAAFEGKFGYYRMYEEGDPEHLLAGLGERFENASSTVKKSPSCTANHAAVDGAIQLAAEHALSAEDVTGVEVVPSHASHTPIGRASFRDSVCQNVSISVVAVALQKKHKTKQ